MSCCSARWCICGCDCGCCGVGARCCLYKSQSIIYSNCKAYCRSALVRPRPQVKYRPAFGWTRAAAAQGGDAAARKGPAAPQPRARVPAQPTAPCVSRGVASAPREERGRRVARVSRVWGAGRARYGVAVAAHGTARPIRPPARRPCRRWRLACRMTVLVVSPLPPAPVDTATHVT